MKQKEQTIKQEKIPAKKAFIKMQTSKQEQQKQKRISLVLAFLLVFIVFAAIAVPVSYIPFLNNIAHKFGLPTAITRQLTLLDLALSSLGVETAAMKAAFAQKEIVEEPADPIFYSRFEAGGSRLINAREAYYHEFERTRRRPDEISGIYKDGKTVDTPDLAQGQVGGVRSLPEEDYLSDDISGTNQGSSFKEGANTGSSFGVKSAGESYTVDTAAGGAQADARKARQSIDKEEDKDTKSSMPGFVSSVYANNGASKGGNQGQTSTQTVDINNSRMIKPVLKGSTFGVSRKETPLETFVGNSDFAKNLSNLRSFGGHDVLGFYIADDAPKNTGRGTFQKFGTSGEDAINSYFYSHVAVGRKYRTSAKYLAELAFSGEKANNEEILVARGQKEDRAPSAAEGDSPLSVMGTLQENIRKCNEARLTYLEETKDKRNQFSEKKELLRRISRNEDIGDGITGGAVTKGAPGSCEDPMHIYIPGLSEICAIFFGTENCTIQVDIHSPTAKTRKKWNNTIDELVELCLSLQNDEKKYAKECNMDYEVDATKDTCNSIKALKVKGGTEVWQLLNWDEALYHGNWHLMPCDKNVIWEDTSLSHAFDDGKCDSANSCITKMDQIFENIDENVLLSGDENFMPF